MKASFHKVDAATVSSYLRAVDEFSSGDIKKRSKVAEKAGKDLIQLIDTFTSFYDDIIKAVRRSAIKGNIDFDSDKFANKFADELNNL
jgi:phosphoserine aminotransferase